MENLYNNRAKKIFSGKNVKVYPTSVPFDERYRVYIESIHHGCTRKLNGVNVLELGCGTGRHFRYLTNVNKLTGVDISSEMLKIASKNVSEIPELSEKTELIHSSIEDFNTSERYDLIYSIGTLGEYCEFNAVMLQKILSLLKPDGIFCFTIVDAESFVNNEYVWPRKKLYRFISRFLPVKWKSYLEKHTLITNDWKPLFLTSSQLEHVLKNSKKKIKWDRITTRDNYHIHHFCKLWISNSILVITSAIQSLFRPEFLLFEEYIFIL